MEQSSVTVAQGLQKVFFGGILSIAAVLLYSVSQPLMLLPLMYLGRLVDLAGFLLVLIGLAGASTAQPDYRAALWCTAGNVVMGCVRGLVPVGLLQTGLGVVSVALDLFVVFWVCRTTAGLLVEAGDLDAADSGARAWGLYVAATVLSLICDLASVRFYGMPVGLFLTLGYLLLRAAGVVAYLAYLFRSQRALRGR